MRTAEPRLLMSVLMTFASVAAMLAALGIYGLFSWLVALRRRELAIRLTLGARPAAVGAMVIRQSAILALLGVTAGTVIVRFAGPLLSMVLVGVQTGDAPATLAAAALLMLAALAACAIPAVRAASTDLAEALRAE